MESYSHSENATFINIEFKKIYILNYFMLWNFGNVKKKKKAFILLGPKRKIIAWYKYLYHP